MSVARAPRGARLARVRRGGRSARTFAALVLAAALLGPAGRAAGGTGDPRTLVVRGRVLAPDGTPVAGARVSTRGSASTAATTDDRGRYSLTVPIGSAAALRRGAFTLEVRAEQGSRRLALGAGASALGLEIALAPGGARVRVRSNSQDATSAISSAFAQDGAATAWVNADFGGAARPGGTPVLNALDEVAVDGSVAGAPRPGERVAVPVRRPRADALPRAAAPVPAAPAPGEPAREITAAAPASHQPVSAPRGPAIAPPTPPRRAHAAPGPAAARDSLAPRAKAVAPSVSRAAAARHARAGRASARSARARAAQASRVAVTVAPAEAAAQSTGSPEPTPPVTNAPERAEAGDTCACFLRGTVEIDWGRPLERNFRVDVSLEGPATQRGEVSMFIGSPREFRFGPLPCGDYRLVVRSRGKLHYVLKRGDSVVTVPCYGPTQSRVVLVPSRH